MQDDRWGRASIALALATLLGLIPLLQFRGIELGSLLRNGAAGVTASAGQRRWRGALVCGEISLVMFLVIAIIAGFLGFGGIAVASAGIAKILFLVFLVLFAVSLIAGLMRRA